MSENRAVRQLIACSNFFHFYAYGNNVRCHITGDFNFWKILKSSLEIFLESEVNILMLLVMQ